MINYYSQSGEDIILGEIFKNKKEGFFVEIGCIDGRRFSNTLTFEERGWRGMCVEAHSGYIDLLVKNRPNSIICHCAVGERDDEEITFYANARGSLSTLDKSKEAFFRERFGQWFTGFEHQRIKKRRMDSIFREYDIRNIDILSLDIEGYEIEALKGISLEQYRPLVFVIEADSREDEDAIDTILLPNGYAKFYKLEHNVFYLAREMEPGNKAGKIIHGEITHTQHPLDKDGDKKINVEIVF